MSESKPKLQIKKNDTLRDLLVKLSPEDGEAVKAAIMKTRNFVLLTSLQMKVRRDEVITPDEIAKILNSPAESLKQLRETPTVSEHHADQAEKVLQYCVSAIEDQLKMLCEFNDSIYEYYKTNPNALREELEKKGGGPKPSSS